MTESTAISEELVIRFFAALEAGDLGTLREIYAPDAVIWHNDDLLEQPVEDNLKVLQGLHRAVSGLRYDIVRRAPTADGVLQQHVLRGRLPNGAEVELHAAMYLQVRDGHITRIEEYLDSAQALVDQGGPRGAVRLAAGRPAGWRLVARGARGVAHRPMWVFVMEVNSHISAAVSRTSPSAISLKRRSSRPLAANRNVTSAATGSGQIPGTAPRAVVQAASGRDLSTPTRSPASDSCEASALSPRLSVLRTWGQSRELLR